MGVTVTCHGCGQGFPLPEGYGRNKIQCPGCGVICPVPAGAGRPGRAESAARPAARAAARAAEPDAEAEAANSEKRSTPITRTP